MGSILNPTQQMRRVISSRAEENQFQFSGGRGRHVRSTTAKDLGGQHQKGGTIQSKQNKVCQEREARAEESVR